MVTKNQQDPIPCRILRRPAVEARTGLSRSTIYLKVAHGLFPRPIPLGLRAVGWIEAEVNAWIQQQVNASRGNTEK